MTIIPNILTVNNNYQLGGLSLFPQDLDGNQSLYDVANSAIAVLTGKLPVNGTTVHANDTGLFPDQGIIRINDELIYYNSKSDGIFTDLIRGFASSTLMTHSVGSVILGCVASLHHNSIRDAIITSENKTGLLSDDPDINGTLTSRVKYLDIKWFTPTPRFYGLPRTGRYPLLVNFRNWSLGDPYIDFEWDFGDLLSPTINSDGTPNPPLSKERHPIHKYYKPGQYDVTLTVTSSDGRKAFLKKHNYIEVVDDNTVLNVLAYARIPKGFDNEFEVLRLNEFGRPTYDNRLPFTVEFVDQTLGFIKSRKWNFGDGSIQIVDSSSYDHTIIYSYSKPGVYWPQLQVLDQNNILRTYSFKQPIVAGMDYRATQAELILGQQINGDLSKPTFGQKNNDAQIAANLQKSLILG